MSQPSDVTESKPGRDPGQPSAPLAVDCDGVHFAYPDGSVALAGLSLEVRVGERVAVLGPNGSGKTTLVLHLVGICQPTAGTVHVGGIPVLGAHLAEVRRRVGVVFQNPDDQLFMPSVAQDVAFGPANEGLEGDALIARVDAALAAVGMAEAADRSPHHLSLGQRRRVALATVLAMRPEILVFDEPSANLDPEARADFAELVRGLARTTIVVTHDLLYAAEVCDRAVIVDDGRVVADGPILEVLADRALLGAHRLSLPRYATLRTGVEAAAPAPSASTHLRS